MLISTTTRVNDVLTVDVLFVNFGLKLDQDQLIVKKLLIMNFKNLSPVLLNGSFEVSERRCLKIRAVFRPQIEEPLDLVIEFAVGTDLSKALTNDLP